jgi:hypothetical protein
MKYPYPVYGWNAVRLSSNLTMGQLQELRLAVESDPKSKNSQHAAGKSIWIYAPRRPQKTGRHRVGDYLPPAAKTKIGGVQ